MERGNLILRDRSQLRLNMATMNWERTGLQVFGRWTEGDSRSGHVSVPHLPPREAQHYRLPAGDGGDQGMSGDNVMVPPLPPSPTPPSSTPTSQ